MYMLASKEMSFKFRLNDTRFFFTHLIVFPYVCPYERSI